MAQVNHQVVSYYDMVDGLNTVSSAIRLKPSECRDVQNMEFRPIGGFSKRNGYDALNDTTVGANDGCTGLYMARYDASGGTNFAYLVAGAKIYSMTGALGGTWTDATGLLSITDNDNLIWNFDILNNICVGCNGSDSPIQIDSAGTAAVLTAGLPFTTFLFPVQSRGYMFYGVPTVGGSIKYDRLYFSDINDPATVGSNNFINVGVGQGGDLKGAVDFKGYLYAFKRSGIFQINYQPTRINSSGSLFPWNEFPNPIVPGVGTQSHRSIVKFTTPSTHATPGQELVFFVDQYGVPRIFDGTTTISFSSKIGTSRDTTIKSLSDMDTTRTKYAFSINYPMKNLIYCFLSDTNSQQDTCWVLDYNVGFSLARHEFALGFNCGAIFEKADGTFKPYVGGYNGKVYQLDTGTTDDGTAIDDYVITGDSFLDSPALESKWFLNDIRGQTGSETQKVKVSYYINGSDTPNSTDTFTMAQSQTKWASFVWGVGSWAKAGIVNEVREVNEVGKTIRTRVESNDKLNDTMILEGFALNGNSMGTSQR